MGICGSPSTTRFSAGGRTASCGLASAGAIEKTPSQNPKNKATAIVRVHGECLILNAPSSDNQRLLSYTAVWPSCNLGTKATVFAKANLDFQSYASIMFL